MWSIVEAAVVLDDRPIYCGPDPMRSWTLVALCHA